MGALQPGEEVRVTELHATGSYLRVRSMGTWHEGPEPRGWVPVSSMELAVQSSLGGKENAASASPCVAKQKRQTSFASPAKTITTTQAPRPTADGSLTAQRVGVNTALITQAAMLFDDCGRPVSHPQHGVPVPKRTLSEEVEVRFETRGSLGLAFCKQAGKIVLREVIAGGAADTLRRTSSSADAAHGLRPGMVLRSVQGQPVKALGFAASMSLLSSAPRPLSLEYEKDLVKPLTPTKASGRSVTAACDAFFVAGMHMRKNAAVEMAELAREYVANGAKLLLSAGNLANDVAVPTSVQQLELTNTVELVRQAELHFVSALRLAPANHAALTLLTEAEKLLADLERRSDTAQESIKRTGSGGVKRTIGDAGLTTTTDTNTLELSITAELSMMLAAPDQPPAGSESGEPDSIKELLAQLRGLDRTGEDGPEVSADCSVSSSMLAGETDASVPMAQLLLDLQVLELEDELELLSTGTLPTPTSAVATPASVQRSASNSSILCTPKAPEPTTDADSVPIDAMDFTTMMASWRLSSSPGAQTAQTGMLSDGSADCASSPTTGDASRISRSASPSAVLEQDIVEFERQLDSVAAARSPKAISNTSMLTPRSPPAIIALPRSSCDDMEEELIGFGHSDILSAAADEPAVRWSPSDAVISPVTVALRKGRGASLMLTAQRRLEMKSQRDLMAIELPDDIAQSIETEDTVLQHQPAKQARLNLTHPNMPPPPVPAVASTPALSPAILTKHSQLPVCAATVVPKIAERFSAPADVRASDSATGKLEGLESVAEASRASRNFWLQKEREMKRTQLVERLNTAVIAASICARAKRTSGWVQGATGEESEQMVV